MKRRFAVKFDRFAGGLTSELRLDQENPKFARTWNFKQTPDRLIQHMGLRRLEADPGHIIEYWGENSNSGQQPHIKRPNFFVVTEDLDGILYEADCDHDSTTFNLGPGNLEMSVEPIYFNNHIVYMRDNGTVWSYQIAADPILTTPAGTRNQLMSGESFVDEDGNNVGYFTNMGSYLIVYGPDKVHIWDPIGTFGSRVTEDFTFTNWMTEDDRNGDVSSFTSAFYGPQGLVLSEVDELQKRLNTLGYGPIPVDGFFGPATDTAVKAFQADNTATGNVPGGLAEGAAIPQTGNFGPETLSAMNAIANTSGEFRSVITTSGNITAEANYGDFVAFATQERDGTANVFIWSGLIESNGFAGEEVRTNVNLGQGAVQILSVVDGRLMAIMSPASNARCINHYNELLIYSIESSLDALPPSAAILRASYHLKIAGEDDDNGEIDRLNYLNRKSQLMGGRLYFSGRLHLQRLEDTESDEGVMSGVFSINRDGNLYFEVSREEDAADFSDERIISFGLVDSGFAYSSDGDIYITDETRESVAGVITNIIDGDGHPYLNKTIDNIYVAFHNTSQTSKAEVWIREVEDIYDADAGWQLAYSSATSPVGEPTTEDKFKNRIAFNRMEDGQRFAQFRELQVMVKVEGICVEIISLYVTGYINETNE